MDEDPPIEEGDATERESYWSDDDGSSSEEYNSDKEDTLGDGSKLVTDSDGEFDSEEIENQHCV